MNNYKLIPVSTYVTEQFEKLFLPTGGVKMFRYVSFYHVCERSQRKNVSLINHKIICA